MCGCSAAQHLPERCIECAETAELRERGWLSGLVSVSALLVRGSRRGMRHHVRQRSVLREEHERAQQLN